MLIGLVRDSVMQCFCHTCRAPVLPAAGNYIYFFCLFNKIRQITFANIWRLRVAPYWVLVRPLCEATSNP